MVEHANLCSQTAKISKSHSPETGMTTITLNHNVSTVGQPTKEIPDTYSLLGTTGKAVEV